MENSKTGRQVLWFFGLWLGGVAAVSLVGFLIKLVLLGA